MTGSITGNIAKALTANLAGRQEWDEPAELYWLDLTKGQVRLRLFPIDQSVFDMGRPPEVLEGLAQAALSQRSAFRQAIPLGLCGLAFFCEAWAVTYARTPEALRAAKQPHGMVSSHPERVEQRVLIAVERSGIRFLVSQSRGGPIESEIIAPGEDVNGQVEVSAGGQMKVSTLVG